MSPDAHSVGKWISSQRALLKLLARDLAQMLNVTPSQVSRWEKSVDKLPLTDTLLDLADNLHDPRPQDEAGSNDNSDDGRISPTTITPEREKLVRAALRDHLNIEGRIRLWSYISTNYLQEPSRPLPVPMHRFVVRIMGEDRIGVLGACGDFMRSRGLNIRQLTLDFLETISSNAPVLIVAMEVRRMEGSSMTADDLQQELEVHLRSSPINMEDARVWVRELGESDSRAEQR